MKFIEQITATSEATFRFIPVGEPVVVEDTPPEELPESFTDVAGTETNIGDDFAVVPHDGSMADRGTLLPETNETQPIVQLAKMGG